MDKWRGVVFRRGLGTDDALFLLRRIDEESVGVAQLWMARSDLWSWPHGLKESTPYGQQRSFLVSVTTPCICGWTFLEFAARVSLSPWILHKNWTRHPTNLPMVLEKVMAQAPGLGIMCCIVLWCAMLTSHQWPPTWWGRGLIGGGQLKKFGQWFGATLCLSYLWWCV